MNRATLRFLSESLHTDVTVTVFLPKPRPSPIDPKPQPLIGPFPVLYLLHGAFDSAEGYLCNTDVGALADQYGLAIVLPSVSNSFYLDEPEGTRYFTYITEELPSYLCGILPLERRREKTFIGGLSMGGYGAVYAALQKPLQYGKVFSMSGALDIQLTTRFVKTCGGALPAHLRDTKALAGGPYDLAHLLREADSRTIPPMHLSCGEQDYFFSVNRGFYEKAADKGLAVSFEAAPGNHEWAYWRPQLARSVAWVAENNTE